MWMLTNGALQKECANQGVDTKGKKMEAHEMIAGIVSKKKSKALTKYDSSANKVTTESLPSNLNRMTESQLRAVAASHGIKVGRKMRKMNIIELLQSEQEKNSNSSSTKKKPLLLTSEGDAGKKRSSSKNQDIESDSESGSGSEYDDGSGSDESEFDPDE